MLSSELKESFETAHAIHRAQRRLQEYQDPEDPRIQGVDVVETDFDNRFVTLLHGVTSSGN